MCIYDQSTANIYFQMEENGILDVDFIQLQKVILQNLHLVSSIQKSGTILCRILQPNPVRTAIRIMNWSWCLTRNKNSPFIPDFAICNFSPKKQFNGCSLINKNWSSEWEINWKPTKHARWMRLRIDTNHNIFIQNWIEISCKAMDHRCFWCLEHKSSVSNYTPN